MTITRNGSEHTDGEIIDEKLLSVYVNGQELMTAMTSPVQQEAFALGFLANEGVIKSLEEVSVARLCKEGTCVDVWLNRSDFEPPRRMILTSGCGGGVTFQEMTAVFPPLDADIHLSPETLWDLMDSLNESARLYIRAGGVHTSGFSDGHRLLVVAEDVGRHNTLDKIRGLTLQQNIPTRGGVILATGRISSEMIQKVRRMEIPVVCSHTSPTSLSIKLAEEWNITVVGYLRRNSMNIYTHPERILRTEPLASNNGHHTENTDGR
jgi:FdhD protein